MSDQPAKENGPPRKRPGRGKPGARGARPGPRRGAQSGASGPGKGSIGLSRLDGERFELVYPRAVAEMELDYEEGIELWKAGDPESARDALRYALSACHANLWIHVALGRIAFDEFHDPALARGHFGYAVELAERALPRGFTGRLPRERPNNRPFYEAIDGLIASLESLGQTRDCASLRALRDRLAGVADL